MSKRIKEMIAGDLKARLGNTRDFLVVDCAKLPAFKTNTLRLQLRKEKISMLSVKNSLARKTLKEMGLDGVGEILKGPSVLVWGASDIVALSKELAKRAKDFKEMEVKGGLLDGSPLSATDVDAISKGPSREETIGRIVMLLLSPGAQLAGALLGPGGYVAGQVKAISEKTEGEAAAAPAAS
jgi:large subunit ribosomal protein L10